MRISTAFLALCTLVVWICDPAYAGVPHLMNYQGILRNTDGAAVPDGSHIVTFRLYDSPEPGGIQLWEETLSITSKAGLFTTSLGSSVPIPEGAFASDAYLAIQVGADPESSPRTRITSVGYAFQAANADKVGGMAIPDLVPPALWDHAFREFVFLQASGETPIFTVAQGKTRYITGMMFTFTGISEMRVDGSAVFIVNDGAESFSWQSGGGAPLVLTSGQTLSVVSNSGARILITGYEF